MNNQEFMNKFKSGFWATRFLGVRPPEYRTPRWGIIQHTDGTYAYVQRQQGNGYAVDCPNTVGETVWTDENTFQISGKFHRSPDVDLESCDIVEIDGHEYVVTVAGYIARLIRRDTTDLFHVQKRYIPAHELTVKDRTYRGKSLQEVVFNAH